MFNKNPHTVRVFEYAGDDGVRHNLADISPMPAPGYKRTRVAMNSMLQGMYPAELCYRAMRASHAPFTVFVDEYQVDADPSHPAQTLTSRCEMNGLKPR